jgi:hypothetical protein
MTKTKLSEAVRRIQALEEELRWLEEARDAIYALLDALGEAEGCFGNCNVGYGTVSHHAEMEISDSLCAVEEKIEEIEMKVWS